MQEPGRHWPYAVWFYLNTVWPRRSLSHRDTYTKIIRLVVRSAWWRHQMETFSALLAICVGNSPVRGEFPSQRPVTRSIDIFFYLRPNKWLNKQWWDWWFETPSSPLWRHCHAEICIQTWQPLSSLPHVEVIKKKHFRVSGPFCREFTGHRWIFLTKTSDANPWCFLWSAIEQMILS